MVGDNLLEESSGFVDFRLLQVRETQAVLRVGVVWNERQLRLEFGGELFDLRDVGAGGKIGLEVTEAEEDIRVGIRGEREIGIGLGLDELLVGNLIWLRLVDAGDVGFLDVALIVDGGGNGNIDGDVGIIWNKRVNAFIISAGVPDDD